MQWYCLAQCIAEEGRWLGLLQKCNILHPKVLFGWESPNSSLKHVAYMSNHQSSDVSLLLRCTIICFMRLSELNQPKQIGLVLNVPRIIGRLQLTPHDQIFEILSLTDDGIHLFLCNATNFMPVQCQAAIFSPQWRDSTESADETQRTFCPRYIEPCQPSFIVQCTQQFGQLQKRSPTSTN